MLKKLLPILVVCLIAAYPAFSAESGPSNTVGFITFECAPGQYVPFAFPFTYYNEGYVMTTNINDIMNSLPDNPFTGGTPATGDRVWNQNDLNYVYMNMAGGWFGAFTNIVPGNAYWVQVMSGNMVVAVTAGEVDMNPLNMGTMDVGYNAVGLRDPGVVMLDDMNLLESGFTGGTPASSDRVWDQNSLSYAYYSTLTSQWMGLSTGIQPGHALWIQVMPGHTPFEWIYTPTGNPPPGMDVIQTEPSISPIKYNPDRGPLQKTGDAPLKKTETTE